MSLLTAPPDTFVAVSRNIFRCQRSVFLCDPFTGKMREHRSQIIEALSDLPSRADRAAASAGPRGNRRIPFMSGTAFPPDFFLHACAYRLRRQFTVLCWVPFGGDSRVCGSEIIDPFSHDTGRTDRTAASLHTGFDLRLPFMSPAAFPPDLPVGTVRNVLRKTFRILRRIPLRKQGRIVRPDTIRFKAIGCVSIIKFHDSLSFIVPQQIMRPPPVKEHLPYVKRTTGSPFPRVCPEIPSYQPALPRGLSHTLRGSRSAAPLHPFPRQ